MSASGVFMGCDVPEADVRAFVDALGRYQRETRRDMKSAVRSATLDLLRSLRARTRKAKKFVGRDEVRKSDLPPKWIARGHAGRPLRRMQIARWSRGERWLDHRYVYGGELERGPRGGWAVRPFSEAHMRREARRVYGRIRGWGLAKKSWGWFMASLFGRSSPSDNPDARITPGMVDREMTETETDIAIEIVNRLDYIRKAMQPGAVAEAVRAASNLINKKISAGLKSRRFAT